MPKLMQQHFITLLATFLLLPALTPSFSLASDFQYGQCLTSKEQFNKEIKQYQRAAGAMASIKSFALNSNPELLTWNYDTVKFIYHLAATKNIFDLLWDIYQINDPTSETTIAEFESYLKGNVGHTLLLQLQENNLEEMDSLLIRFYRFLGHEDTSRSRDLEAKFKRIYTYFNTSSYNHRKSIFEVYQFIQNAAIDVDFLSKTGVEQWRNLIDYFFSIPEVLPLLEKIYDSSPILTLENGKKIRSGFLFSDSEFNTKSESRPQTWKSLLPPLLKLPYPKAFDAYPAAQKMLQSLFSRSIEDFLFSVDDIDSSMVKRWMPLNKKYSEALLYEALRSKGSRNEKTDASKIHKYLANQNRAYSNAFDHYVWQRQEGTAIEKTIDGVARTLYSEAESCQKYDNSRSRPIKYNQLQPIGLVIASRTLAVDKENRRINLFQTLPNAPWESNPKSKNYSSTPKASDYKGAIRDFSRNNEIIQYPFLSEMLTPAKIVSKADQFSVWKVAKTMLINPQRWIPQLSRLGYPETFSVAIAGASSSTMDDAQHKALCPRLNSDVFTESVQLATQIVTNPQNYVQKYVLHEKSKKYSRNVLPYFFTHGKRTKLGAKSRSMATNQLTLYQKETNQNRYLPMINPNGTESCRHFRLYAAHPDYLWTPKEVQTWKERRSF